MIPLISSVVAIVVLFGRFSQQQDLNPFYAESVMPVFMLDEHVRAEQRRRAAIVFGQVKSNSASG